MRFIIGLFIVSIISITSGYAQLSEGGFPMSVISQKKGSTRSSITLPTLQQSTIDSLEKSSYSTDTQLKKLKFAYPFKVNLNPSNSGQWYISQNGYNVWKLTITSENAKSLNLIFDNFKLQKNTRLFIYSSTTNQYLGAFTSSNNKKSGKFAVAPIAGDIITIQYEVPEKMETPSDFEIVTVNHDFIGILKTYRRPSGETTGTCNVDINCEIAEKYKELKNACCRLIINGSDICSGTLINNTSEEEKPYIISAWHCFEGHWKHAETTIFTFNYESPFCAPLDGDPIHTLSGATMKALYDSLDFALMEMDITPPKEYRPYYAGWDRSSGLTDSSFSIHHPQGDIKKISFDYDAPQYYTYTSAEIKNPENGSFKISRWDEGVTEGGSSGGALYNMDCHIIGTLTGGSAMCGYPVNDYFARFAMQWDYKSDSSKQLKYWLDPANTNAQTLEGKQFYTGEDLCEAFTHLSDNDNYKNVLISSSDTSQGYWGGTNNIGINEIVERFYISGNEILDGISLGIGKLTYLDSSKITIKVYKGNSSPENLIYSKLVSLSSLVADAMNYISFDETIEPTDTFFVGFNFEEVSSNDSIVIFQSLRKNTSESNYFYYKQDDEWYNFKTTNSDGYAMVNVMELIACNCNESGNSINNISNNICIYPNPTKENITIKSDREIKEEYISVFNLLGQAVDINTEQESSCMVNINLSGETPGIYFVRIKYNNDFIVKKISYVP